MTPTLEQIKQILANAPEGATHCTDTVPSMNLYAKVEHLGGFYVSLSNRWEPYPIYAGIHLLSDLREILTLRQRVEELETQAPKWISVDDELPEWGVIVLVFIPERDGEDAYVTMDCMDEDFEYWQLISEDYDHAQAAGRVTDSDKMPSGVAPYTHWMPLQQPPKEVA